MQVQVLSSFISNFKQIKMAKQNKTICLELDTIKKAKKQADKLKLSFSAYLETLILEK